MTVSTAISVLEVLERISQYPSGVISAAFGVFGRFSLGSLAETGVAMYSKEVSLRFTDIPRKWPVANRGLSGALENPRLTSGFCWGLGEERDSLLCALRSPPGVRGGVPGSFMTAKTLDDLSIAALTPGSIVASFGRIVVGICSSSYN